MTEDLKRYYDYEPVFTMSRDNLCRAEISWTHALVCMARAKVNAYKAGDLEQYYEILGMVTHDIRWSLCWGELLELAMLHARDFFREIIEDILEDINFHTDCKRMKEGNYMAVWEECLKGIKG